MDGSSPTFAMTLMKLNRVTTKICKWKRNLISMSSYILDLDS